MSFNTTYNNTTTLHNTTTTTTSHSNYVVLLAPLMFGAFFGNALVILAFKKGPRKLRTLTNYFVVNLAVSDMLIGCVSLPLWIAINSGEVLFISTSLPNSKQCVLHSMNVRSHFSVSHQTTCHFKDLVSIYSKSIFFRGSYSGNHCDILWQEMRLVFM